MEDDLRTMEDDLRAMEDDLEIMGKDLRLMRGLMEDERASKHKPSYVIVASNY